MELLVVNGPNLNLLGTREPEIYGTMTLADLEARISEWAADLEMEATSVQHNDEAEIIAAIHGFTGDGIVINPAALSHTSRAVADALAARSIPTVEVHISNIWEREEWRRQSVVSASCVRTIYGRGISGYRDAMRHLANRARMGFTTVRYGPHPDNVGDLRHGEAGTLVVLVHGGLWRHEHEMDSMESLAVDLAQRGLTTWNLEYRRNGRGGGWPASPHDVKTALDFVPHLDLEVDRVVGLSHSAGSQLLMWAAARSRSTLSLHVALGALLDLGACAGSDGVGSEDCAVMIEQGAPAETLPGTVPTALVHGTADQIVSAEQTRTYAGRHGIELLLTDTDHFRLLNPGSPEWDWVLERLLS